MPAARCRLWIGDGGFRIRFGTPGPIHNRKSEIRNRTAAQAIHLRRMLRRLTAKSAAQNTARTPKSSAKGM